MVLLQPKLSLKVAQRQILTPGLMQMVSVLALNKLELKEMINAEIVENPVLEELDEHVPLLEDMAGREAERDRSAQEIEERAQGEKQDSFDEIDFGSYFQDYLDPGFRTPNSFEQSEKPSFENFLSQPGTLSDHLSWQLGSLNVSLQLREAAEYVIGNLDEDGYLPATEEELLAGLLRELTADSTAIGGERVLLAEAIKLVQTLDPAGVGTPGLRECLLAQIEAQRRDFQLAQARRQQAASSVEEEEAPLGKPEDISADRAQTGTRIQAKDPTECHEEKCLTFALAAQIIGQHLPMLQKRDLREMSKVLGKPPEAVQQAIDFIRTLDPRPGPEI